MLQLISTALLLSWTCEALPKAAPWSAGHSKVKNLYTISNEVSGNSLVTISIEADGSLSGGAYTTTGAVGGNYVSPTDGHPLVPDSLATQDSLIAIGDYLFAVNAGSDSVTMIRITNNGAEVIGEPQSSVAQFPTTLAASLEKGLVCVGNSGAISGVACASFSETGLSSFDALRSLDVGQTQTPPTGPVPGISDMFFSNDSSSLFVMVKGNPGKFTTYAAQFAVSDTSVATTANSKATPPNSAVLFGTAPIPGSSKVLASDAGFGALLLNLDDLSADPIAIVNVTGQQASCWAEISSFTGTGFITDAGVDRLVEIDLSDGSIVQTYYPPTPFPGMTDIAISGTYLWALSAGNGTTAPSISTFDLSAGRGKARLTSTYAVPGGTPNLQGLVVV